MLGPDTKQIRERTREAHATASNTKPKRIKFWDELSEAQKEQVSAMYADGTKWGRWCTYCLGISGDVLSRRPMEDTAGT